MIFGYSDIEKKFYPESSDCQSQVSGKFLLTLGASAVGTASIDELDDRGARSRSPSMFGAGMAALK